MRYINAGVTVLALLLIPFGMAAGAEETSTRNLDLPAEGIQRMEINCGAGFLKVSGMEGLSSIRVEAKIEISGVSSEDLDGFLKENGVLTLEKKGEKAVLVSKTDKLGHLTKSGKIDLTVELPKMLSLSIADGSGSIEVADLNGDLDISDGSGDLAAGKIGGKVSISDGSGDISLESVNGSVNVSDGSGDIRIMNVGGDLNISDGSGDIDVRSISGNVNLTDGSGTIYIDGVEKDVNLNPGTIYKSGIEKEVDLQDGKITIKNVKGRVSR